MSGQLELIAEPFAQLSDLELLREAADAALFLSLGPDTTVGAAGLVEMRRRLHDAAAELSRRWSL